MEKMKALYEKVSADPALQQRFGEIVRNEKKAGEEEIREKLAAFAKEAGFDVTIGEILCYEERGNRRRAFGGGA